MRKNAIFSFFDSKTAIKSFMVGTYNNYSDKNNELTHYDDLETCMNIFQKGCKMTGIQFVFLENRIIGYHIAYIDILNRVTSIYRLAKNYKHHKIDKNKDFQLRVNEHLVDLVITFNHEMITSVSIRTDQENSVHFGVVSPSTSISKLDPSSPELNVIFGFETNFSEDALKEIFIYRGAIIKRKKSATVISAEKYHKLVMKSTSDNIFEGFFKNNLEKTPSDLKDATMKRLQEIQGINQGEMDDKAVESPEKSVNDEIWNEEKLADQEKAQSEDEMDKELDITRKGKRSSMTPKNKTQVLNDGFKKKKI